jgi:hypothetical protein
MWKCDNAVMGEKLTRYESSMTGCIVIMEQPTAHAPQFRSFSPNFLPQMAKNIAVKLGIHGLAFQANQCTHSHTVIGWRSMELVSKLFDTITYFCTILTSVIKHISNPNKMNLSYMYHFKI